MFTLAVLIIGSYFLGSIPFGYLASRLRGIDIRKSGSGNIGATNVVRVLGKRYGYPVFALDVLKGFSAVKISMVMAPGRPPEWNSPEIFGILAAMSSFLGHLYPIFLNFKGGKGVATSFGVLLGLAPLATIILLVVFAAVAFTTRIVSLSSMVTAVAAPLVLWLFYYSPTYVIVTAFMALMIVFRHYANIQRLLNGTEPRFGTR